MIPPSMVGRKDLSLKFAREMEAVAKGAGRCLVIEGPAGIGKSTFLQKAAEMAADNDMMVAAGRATTLDRVAPMRALMAPLRRTLGQSALIELDLIDVNGADGNPFWLVDTLGDLIEEHARNRPLLIALDDAHWADELTTLALRALVPALAESPVLWLLARRPVPADTLAQPVIDWLARETGHQLTLQPLEEDAVHELCARLLGASPDPSVLALGARTRGNPFLVTKLFEAMRDAGHVLITDGVASITAAELPPSFLAAIDGLLRDLSHEASLLVTAGAVLGRPFTVREATRLTGLPAVELLPAVGEAVQAEVLVDHGLELAFRNELISNAVRDGLPRSVLSELQREAVLLCPRSQPPSGDARRSRKHRRAVARAAKQGHVSQFLLTSSTKTLARTTTLRILDVLRKRGNGRLSAVVDAVCLLNSVGRADEAVQLESIAVDAGAYAAETDSPASGTRSGGAAAGREPVAEGRPAGAAAQREALAHGATGAQPDPAATGHDKSSELPLWLWLARGLGAADRFTEAETVYAVAQHEIEQLGAEWPEPLYRAYRGELRMEAGVLDEAAAEAEKGIRSAEEMSEPQLCVLPMALLARVAIHRGDADTADDYLRRAARLAVKGASLGLPDLTWALALFHDAAGRPSTAIETLTDVFGQVAIRELRFAENPSAPAHLVRLALRAGTRALAEAAVTSAGKLAASNPTVVSLAAAATHAKSLLRRDTEMLRSAAEQYQSAGRPLAYAAALEDAAWAERSQGYTGQAAELLERALDTYRASGAWGDVTRTQGRLRCLTSPSAGTATSCRPAIGWNSLSDAELRVVEAVASGLTNREAAKRLFLSPHTVDSHLRHVFTKLGVNSRVELAREFFLHNAPAASQEEPAAADRPERSGSGSKGGVTGQRHRRPEPLHSSSAARRGRKAAPHGSADAISINSRQGTRI